MKKGKRIFSKLVATLSILAILLGGTFAWYAATQAVNSFRGTYTTTPPPELGDVGGNLHDNFPGAGVTDGGEINKDVFVENTGDSNIFVRVTLSELLGTLSDTNKPAIRKANEALAPAAGAAILQPGIDAGFTWKLGGALDPYKSITESPEWLAIMANAALTDAEKMTRLDELVADQLGGASTNEKANTGGAGLSDKTGMPNATVINMKQYSLMTDEAKAGFVGWIYDTDGYAYWSQQLSPGTATGLLLDSVNIPSAGSRVYEYDIIVNMEYVDATDLSAWMSNTAIKEGASAGQDATTATDAAIDFLQRISGRPKQPTQGVGTIATTRTLTNAQTGDGDWIEIATNGGYSLIVRRSALSEKTRFSSTDDYTAYASQTHISGNLRYAVNDWYTNTLSIASPLREYAVGHDALTKPGTVSHLSAENGFSVPTGELKGMGSDVAFVLSFQEAATYMSSQWSNNISGTETFGASSADAIANFNRLQDGTSESSWLRSPGRTSASASYLYRDGGVRGHGGVTYTASVRPALWVESSIFDQ
jgi:hypothetical protein